MQPSSIYQFFWFLGTYHEDPETGQQATLSNEHILVYLSQSLYRIKRQMKMTGWFCQIQSPSASDSISEKMRLRSSS